MNRYLRNQQGQGMSEYLILVLLIAVGSIAATQSLGSTVFSKIHEIQRKIHEVNFTASHEETGSNGDH